MSVISNMDILYGILDILYGISKGLNIPPAI